MTARLYGRKWVALAFALFAFNAHATDLKVQVLSATVKDQKIPGATVILQRNGAQSIHAVTDDQGSARLTQDQADDAN